MRRAFALDDRVELLQHVVPVARRAWYVSHVATNVVGHVVRLLVGQHLLDLVNCLVGISRVLLQVDVALRDRSMSIEDVVSPKDEARMSGETADVAGPAVDSGFLRIFD